FLYAAREVGKERKAMYIMVSYVPFLKNVGELKTKPTQHAISELRMTGIMPDALITRSEMGMDEPRLETLAKRCFLDNDSIFDDPDCDSIYDVPLILEKQGLVKKIKEHFNIKDHKTNLKDWEKMVEITKNSKKEITIALVGKYVKSGNNNHKDVYVSVLEAIRHAGVANKIKIIVKAIDSNNFKASDLKDCDGIIAPQGWGTRGVEGIIGAIKFARENKIPFLGLCFGMQMSVVEIARDMANLKKANSIEADPKTKYPVINLMPEQEKYLKMHQYGGTIRLGSWPCKIKKGTKLYDIYKKDKVEERHRHRYEFNNDYRKQLEKVGLIVSGTSPDGKLVEAIELKDHPFFIATQFHPEYKSRPLAPHPVFKAFVKAIKK
ncbi:MAG: CTP synthase, partial [Candidatus Shapirobacteria bacterium]|nr:CTP synthase [Candidatus Shapirobacteria bacterium]